jgi:aspartyl-tRNA(Asn)/glutamyl-tRNA(Gln) amidotransferase subunit C
MKIDDNLITDLSRLSKLEIKEDFTKMLDFVEKLSEVDTEGVEPLIYLTEGYQNPRKDVMVNSTSQLEALQNAPLKDSDYIKVPKFLSKK